MNKLLSIVVPVYKVENYINKCLDSLIVPDELMEQLEVIIVNDGTPDRSAEMAREYEKRFPQTFRVIDKENGGHGSAWNRGLKEANGKYLRFLDSDDWLTNLDVFMNNLTHIDEDMVYTNVCRYYEDVNKEEVDSLDSSLEYDITFQLEKVDLRKLQLGFWNWTYKTELLKKNEPLFVEHVYYDDAILFYTPVMLSNSFRAIDVVLYNYRLGRPGQTMNRAVQKKHAADYSPVSISIVDFVSTHIDRVPLSKQLFIKESLSHYIGSCFNWFLLLDYNDFKKVMKTWLPYVLKNRQCYCQLNNRINIYRILPSYIGYIFIKNYAKFRD